MWKEPTHWFEWLTQSRIDKTCKIFHRGGEEEGENENEVQDKELDKMSLN